MCLYLKEGESVRIASRNILVKKWIKPIKDSNSWVPVLRKENGKLEFNKVLRAKYLDSEKKLTDIKRLRVDIDSVCTPHIEAGFHSYRLSATPLSFYREAGTKYYSIIPKGSEYAIGKNGNIVSTKIIVFSNLLKYLKWKMRRNMID